MQEYYIKGKRYIVRENEVLCQTRYSNGIAKHTLYRTKKGGYFMVHFRVGEGRFVYLLTEAQARRFMDVHPEGIRHGYYDSIFGKPGIG